jgi:hypothetical protein
MSNPAPLPESDPHTFNDEPFFTFDCPVIRCPPGTKAPPRPPGRPRPVYPDDFPPLKEPPSAKRPDEPADDPPAAAPDDQ